MSPRLLICGFSAFPEAPRNPAQAAVEALAADGWSPEGVTTDYLTLPVAWRGSAEAALSRLAASPADGVLVVGVAVKAEAFHVERLGRNLAGDRPDHAGEMWDAACIAEAGEAELRSTAPHRSMAAAIAAEGLPVELSEDAGDYLCNFTLYRLLQEKAAPVIGFLHAPQAVECAEGARFTLAQIIVAVRAAAGAMAASLTPPAAVSAQA